MYEFRKTTLFSWDKEKLPGWCGEILQILKQRDTLISTPEPVTAFAMSFTDIRKSRGPRFDPSVTPKKAVNGF